LSLLPIDARRRGHAGDELVEIEPLGTLARA
jgi:hypothetical protein